MAASDTVPPWLASDAPEAALSAEMVELATATVPDVLAMADPVPSLANVSSLASSDPEFSMLLTAHRPLENVSSAASSPPELRISVPPQLAASSEKTSSVALSVPPLSMAAVPGAPIRVASETVTLPPVMSRAPAESEIVVTGLPAPCSVREASGETSSTSLASR